MLRAYHLLLTHFVFVRFNHFLLFSITLIHLNKRLPVVSQNFCQQKSNLYFSTVLCKLIQRSSNCAMPLCIVYFHVFILILRNVGYYEKGIWFLNTHVCASSRPVGILLPMAVFANRDGVMYFRHF